MEQSHPLRDTFLRRLSDYSACIQPYLRNVQDKYVAAYYVVESEKVDLTAYCQKEFAAVQDIKSKITGGSSE